MLESRPAPGHLHKRRLKLKILLVVLAVITKSAFMLFKH